MDGFYACMYMELVSIPVTFAVTHMTDRWYEEDEEEEYVMQEK